MNENDSTSNRVYRHKNSEDKDERKDQFLKFLGSSYQNNTQSQSSMDIKSKRKPDLEHLHKLSRNSSTIAASARVMENAKLIMKNEIRYDKDIK